MALKYERCRRCRGTGYLWVKHVGPKAALCPQCLGGGLVNRNSQPSGGDELRLWRQARIVEASEHEGTGGL